MKIVHVLLGKANPERMNGVNKVVHHLATEQHRAGHEVEVWGLSSTWERGATHSHEYTLRLFPVTHTRFLLAAPLLKLLRRLHAGTWVQMHSVFIPEFYGIAAILHRRGLPFGVTPHGGYSPHVLARSPVKKSLYMLAVEASVLKRASLIHAIGQTEVGDIRALAPSAHVVLVPNGQEPLRCDTTDVSSPSGARPTFAFCGRLDARHKGLDLLLSGFATHLKRGNNGTLWLIGDGPDRRSLEAQTITLGIDRSVKFHGAVFGEPKLDLLCAADVFVHTSRWDVVPTAVLEAAALGLPLLVSTETNLGDPIVRAGAGIVLGANTVPEIARAMSEFTAKVESNGLRDVGHRARGMVENWFAWPVISAELVSHFRSAQDRQGVSF